MTLYQQFKKLNIDHSAIGLEPCDTYAPCFCTPKGAKVIGCAGVDGIHYYTIFPELEDFYLRDCDKGDGIRAKRPNYNGPVVGGAVGLIGMIKSDGEHTYFHPDGTRAKARAFCSSLHFEPVSELKLNIVFREKRVPDMEVRLI